MKIGFYSFWNRGDGYIGDHMYAESMCKTLKNFPQIDSANLYTPEKLPEKKLDIMIYLNDCEPKKELANKHIAYLQNSYAEGSENALKKFQQRKYDGYIFISNKLFQIHQKSGGEGLFLPFGVDTNFFTPVKDEKDFAFDVSYVGNDIKGEKRSTKYILPATNFNFGLFGHWGPSKRDKLKLAFKIWKHYKFPIYQEKFMKISKGRISQSDTPKLYSSSKINLNCTGQDSLDWGVITARIFEILACKGFVITDYSEITEKLLKGCVVFTEGDEDLINKIKYYLKNPEKRKKIAQKGYEYAIKNASMESRMKTLYKYLETLQ